MPNSKEAGTEADRGDDVKLNSRDSVALKDLLQKRLSECGWRKDIEDMIRHTIEERGVSNLTHDQLAAEIVPHARALVPDVIRKEMLMRVRAALDSSLPQEQN
ncbi:enhancer of yellow 2b transcription factor isoform X2 [Drosophila biarmipes]|uniref:enhancer of yellow 2b transcription factor isoform X2 n=1 Tax=Drosophila biarmipes TaxID=125945 RepID=UPI0007E5F86A|nr:enhancer of yellow 2b transcription factor isoform X2 [Drosophila biarmipes]